MVQDVELNRTAIVDSTGLSYTFRELENNIRTLSHIFKVIDPDQIGIHTKSEFQTVSAIFACLNTATNFVLLPTNLSNEVYLTRCSMSSIDLLLSDSKVDDNIITLHPYEGIKTKGGAAADILGSRELLEDLTSKVDLVISSDDLSEVCEGYATLKQGIHICFHKGICLEGFKFSGFTLDKIVKGIEKAQELHTFYSKNNSILFLEELDLLYDVVNGVLAPLQKGMTVVFANTVSYGTLLESVEKYAETIYCSATTIENLLTLLENETPEFFKKLGSWVKKQYLKRTIRNYFNSSIKHLIITGKINKLDSINLFDVPVTTLYTMSEVASFVSFKQHAKLTADASVGKVNREFVHIITDSKSHGGILVYTDDMAVHTNSSFKEESFFHKYPGRLYTKDVGFIDANDELHVINKTNLVFEEFNGKIVPTGKIIDFALKKPFVKKALIITTSQTTLTLLVEPDLDWAIHNKATQEDLEFLCRNLSENISSNFNGSYPINAVLYTDSEGIDCQLYKIIVRR